MIARGGATGVSPGRRAATPNAPPGRARHSGLDGAFQFVRSLRATALE